METAVKTNNWKISFDEAKDLFGYTGGRKTFNTCCPVHDDRDPSLTISEGDEGQALFFCHSSGCPGNQKEATEFMKEIRKYFRGDSVNIRKTVKRTTSELLPLTIEELAEEKGLTVDYLKKIGVYQSVWRENNQQVTCVNALYFLENGDIGGKKLVRMNQEIKREGREKQTTKAIRRLGSDDLIPYGLNKLNQAREIGHLLIVEGESDCWTLWQHDDFPSIGLPGSGQAKLLKAEYVDGINSIYAIDEKGSAGRGFIRGIQNQLQKIRWKGHLYILSMPDECKDPNDLHLKLKDKNQFVVKMVELIGEAKTYEEWEVVASEMEAKEIVAATVEAKATKYIQDNNIVDAKEIQKVLASAATEAATAKIAVGENQSIGNVISIDEKRENKKSEGKSETKWLYQLDTTTKGTIKNTSNNLDLILKNDDNLKGRFAYNLFTHMEEIIKDVPWARQIQSNGAMTDADDAGLKIYLSRKYGIEASDRMIASVLKQNVLLHKHHPVKDYLEKLKWDGVPRLDKIIIDCFGAADTELNRMQTRLSLVGAVARVFDPGCKFDYVLTLKGAQGAGKSSFFRKLAIKDDWFTDGIKEIKGKETKEMILGKWIIEFGEMSVSKKSDQETLKQFITAQYDEFRAAYARRTSSYPRQCIFVASTNNDEPLKDDTGNRRWWIIDVSKSWSNLEQPFDENQIWAEAVHQYNQMKQKNQPLMLPPQLEETAKKIQYENTYLGEYQAEIVYVLNELGYYKKWDGSQIKVDETCAKHVWLEILGNPENEYNQYKGKQITQILKNLKGWEYVGQIPFKGDSEKVYGRQRVYRRTK
jgi:predicted P-loop ATPase